MYLKNYFKALAAYTCNYATGVTYINVNGVGKTISAKYPNLHWHETASNNDFINVSTLVTNDYLTTSAKGGTILGTGTTPPTLDDYQLSGNQITTFTYSVNTTKTADDNGIEMSFTFTITNTGSESFTIGEVAVFGKPGGKNAEHNALLERTVLDTPVTISAGGVGQVTYTIRLNYPTA